MATIVCNAHEIILSIPLDTAAWRGQCITQQGNTSLQILLETEDRR